MSIEVERERIEAPRTGRPEGARRLLTLALVAGAMVLGACGGGESAEAGTSETAAATSIETPPAAEEPATVADIFPEGEGRQIVLNNCASCHAVACTAIGQRTEGRWGELREAHREHVPTLSEESLVAAFAYLSANFGADRPEPNVPARFLEGGCTPF